MDNYKEEFGKIYENYVEKIYRFVYLKVNSQEIAEDLTSQVFIKSFDSYKKGLEENDNNHKQIKNPGAFLYKVASNIVTDHYREIGKAKLVSTDAVPMLPDDGTDPHEKAILSMDIQKAKNAIQGLKKDYQDVIIWHYLEDMSVEEISQITNKPAGTVRVMIHRGLNALKGDLLIEEA